MRPPLGQGDLGTGAQVHCTTHVINIPSWIRIWNVMQAAFVFSADDLTLVATLGLRRVG